MRTSLFEGPITYSAATTELIIVSVEDCESSRYTRYSIPYQDLSLEKSVGLEPSQYTLRRTVLVRVRDRATGTHQSDILEAQLVFADDLDQG